MLTVSIIHRITTGYIDSPAVDDKSINPVELNENTEL